MDFLTQLLRDLWSERGRVGLVGLGVLWGTLGLAVLLSFGQEMVRATSVTMDSFGVDLLRLFPGATTRPFAGLPAGVRVPLTLEDAAVLRGLPGVRGTAIEYASNGEPIRAGEQRRNMSLCGVGPGFGALRNQNPQAGGRFLNLRDQLERRRVAFLGSRIKENLFGSADAVGRVVEIRDVPFTVIGVLEYRVTSTNYNGEDRDKVSIPASTMRDITGRRNPTFIFVGLERAADKDRVTDDLYTVLGARHKFHPDDRDAVELQDYVALHEMIDTILDGNRIFTAIVGLLGLLVAAVGVANVMVVRVEERTREIGVQLALGARPRWLVAERVLEGLLVTLLGGLAGLAAAAVLLWAASQVPAPEARAYFGFPRVTLGLAGTIVGLLVLAGAGAAWSPARRVVALDPIEALRDE